LQKLSGEVNKNLILNDKQIQATEEYRLAMDELNDTVMGLKVAFGGDLINDMNAFFWQLEHGKEIAAELTKNGDPLGDLFLRNGQAAAEETIKLRERREELEISRDAMQSFGDAVSAVGPAAEMTEEELAALEEQVQAISEKNQAFIGVLDSVSGALETYNAGIAEADAALAAGDMTTAEHAAAVNALADEYKQASNQIVLSIVQMKLATDGWTNNELAAYLKVGKSLGAFTDAEVKAAGEAIKMADAALRGVEPIMHIGERAEDAADGFGTMGSAAQRLGDTIRKDALPAVSGLKNQINGLPPTGTGWSYYFDISVSGRVPNLTGQSPYANTYGPGNNGPAIAMASGGRLPGSGFTLVGDAPGGAMTPYTEAIINGMVLDAKTTRKLKDAGLLDGARALAGGGFVSDSDTRTYSSGSTTTTRRASSGTRVGNAASVDGGTSSTSADVVTISETAAMVSEQAVSTAGIAVAAQQQNQNQLTQMTAQQTQATLSSGDNTVAAIHELTRQVQRLATRDDMLAAFKYGQQTSL
jgi:polyhydroxyalkanoate synthesis regulator phasin